jgi:hypothetical protein
MPPVTGDASNKTVDIKSEKTPDIRLKTQLWRVNPAYGFALFISSKPYLIGHEI